MVVNFDTGFPWLDTFLTVVLMILFTYPILGGFAWFIGVICNRFLFRYRQLEWIPIPEEIEPMITIMVPAHNEEIVIEDTIHYLMNNLNYSNYEVLVTDDGSTDQTPVILDRLMEQYPNLRVLRIEKIKEKPMPLILG